MKISALFVGLIAVSTQLAAQEAVQEGAPKPSFAKVVIEAFAQENAKNYSKAYELYSQALTIRDDSPTVWIRRAHTQAMLGKTEDVSDDLKIGMTKAPVSVTDYLTLSWFRGTAPFQSLRDGSLAVAFAQKALREAESIEAYDALAAGYAEMGDFTQARKMAMQGIKRFPASTRIPAMQERVELYNKKKTFTEPWGSVENTKMARQVEDALKKE